MEALPLLKRKDFPWKRKISPAKQQQTNHKKISIGKVRLSAIKKILWRVKYKYRISKNKERCSNSPLRVYNLISAGNNRELGCLGSRKRGTHRPTCAESRPQRGLPAGFACTDTITC